MDCTGNFVLVINSGLESVCKDAIKDGLELLSTKADKTKALDKLGRRLEIFEHRDEIVKLPSIQKLLKVLVDLPELERFRGLITPKTQDAIETHFQVSYIDKFIHEYAYENGFVFDEKKFLSLYTILEDCIYERADFRYFGPLYAFESEEDSVTIDDITIRKISEDEFKKLFGGPEEIFIGNIMAFGIPPKFLIETKSKKCEFEMQIEKIQYFLYAFALFKSQIIQMNEIWCTHPMFHPGTSGSGREIISKRGRKWATATLLKSEMNEFQTFYNRFKKIQKPLPMKTAIKRFHSGLESRDFEDTVIDFMIALECLYGDNKPELTRTISTRVAILLGKDELDTERLRIRVRDLYNIRSAIVHGGNLKKACKDAHITENEAQEKLKEIANASILSFLNLIESKRVLGVEKEIQSIKMDIDMSISSPQYRKQLQKIAKI